jgi:hypothetical protein
VSGKNQEDPVMNKNTAAGPASGTQTISILLEISRLDTLYRDLYFQRAQELMEPVLSQAAYVRMKEGLASTALVEKQLRAAIERGDWSRAHELTERIRGIQASAAASGEWMKYGEALYDGAADIHIDPFSPGLYVFAGGSAQRLQEWQDRAIAILSTLKRTDTSKKDFYSRRESDFEALSIAAPRPAGAEEGDDKSGPAPAGSLRSARSRQPLQARTGGYEAYGKTCRTGSKAGICRRAVCSDGGTGQ